ncbi:MAG: UDP-N-acetylmuramoyl-L-alanine--D-glutamate ligase [bacterium]|nr:UDP-N-acetylmuramoyl-L-alanine--D-glutamate ligase [bacterium]
MLRAILVMVSRVLVTGHGITAQAVHAHCARVGYPCVSLSDTVIQATDWVVMSPGVDPTTVPVPAGAVMLSEVEFAYREWERLPADQRPQIIGVTGTNGKSTTATLIAQVLDCPVVGNIGDPLIGYVGGCHKQLVCELSSYQLELCDRFTCTFAVLLNIQPDHLERHGTLDAYMRAKMNIVNTNTDHVVYNAADARLKTQSSAFGNAACHPIYPEALPEYSTWATGPAQWLSVQAAVSVGALLGVPAAQIRDRMAQFRGLPHRMERVLGGPAGVAVYNDSKATNPAAAAMAVACVAGESPMVLIVCGQPKAVCHADLWAQIHQHVTAVVVCGGMVPMVTELVAVGQLTVPVTAVDTVAEAVEAAFRLAAGSGVVLFSPAGSSHDAFETFAQRGEVFKACVAAWR